VKSITGTAGNLLQSPAARRRLQIGVVVLVLLFFMAAIYGQMPQLASYRWTFDPGYFALAGVLLVARGPVVAYGWWTTMRLLGYPLPFGRSVRIIYHSALARYLPGQVWYAVSRVYLAEREGVPRLVTAVSIGIETAMIVVGAVLVSALSLSVWHAAPVWLGAIILAAFLGVVLQPRLLFGALNRVLVRLGRTPIEVRLSSRDMARLVWPYTLNWLVYAIMAFALTASLYPTLSWTQAPAVGGLITAAWLIGFLTIIVPQGLVVREGLIFTFLTTLVGVPAPVATAAAVLLRAWSTLGEALWAGISTRF
jgi:glycosyltransferase 2 family protein